MDELIDDILDKVDRLELHLTAHQNKVNTILAES